VPKGLRESSFYPWLFSLFPALFLYSHNLDEAPGRTALLASALSLALTVPVWLAARALARDGQRAALLTFLFCLMFFTYGHLGNRLDLPPWVLLPWGAAFLVMAAMVLLTRRNLSGWIPGLNLFALVLVLSAAAQMAWPRPQVPYHDLGMTDLREDARLAATRPDRSLLPDIYYLILDRYANAKVLEALFGFDNREFLGFLRTRGFYVAGDSRCNYPRTYMSLASSLNMDYIDRARGKKDFGKRSVYHILKDFRVRRVLKSLGYTYFHLESWWQGAWYNPFADHNLTGKGIDRFWNDFFQKFVGTTALQPFVRPLLIIPRKRAGIPQQFAQLERIPAAKGPRFVFAHIMTTHRPYVFGPKGEDSHDPGQRKEFTYIDQVRYTNTLLMRMVSALLKSASRPVVIILQSDEGPKPGPKVALRKRKMIILQSDEGAKPGPKVAPRKRKWRTSRYLLERETHWQKSMHEPILNAMAFPGVDTSVLYPSISPVNTFRVLFNLYFGAHYPLLPDETRAASGRDVTDESD